MVTFSHKFRVKTRKVGQHKHHASLFSKCASVSSISCLPRVLKLPRRELDISSPLFQMKAQMCIQSCHAELGLYQKHQSFRPAIGLCPLLKPPKRCSPRRTAGLTAPCLPTFSLPREPGALCSPHCRHAGKGPLHTSPCFPGLFSPCRNCSYLGIFLVSDWTLTNSNNTSSAQKSVIIQVHHRNPWTIEKSVFSNPILFYSLSLNFSASGV